MWTRRVWLLGSVAIGTVLAAGVRRGANASDGKNSPIPQPAKPSPQAFIDRAFAMRRRAVDEGGQPYGAVIVRDGIIVGEAPSRVVTHGDPTAHAEMETIRDAVRRLGSRNLGGCVMYSSSPPCPMCEAAAYWAGIDRLYYRAGIVDGGAPRLARC
ncbi:MAG: nucleoside deaminase [Alphaproteobacteria bacterium]|nr:nucleoside deaminase [Alphaproteobacteria bacterium]